ncbi:DUF4198 domain-containing protein [Kiloniella laminariae]|uniref:DUF4198 domain-containing protein n=1 Tax=Kiloniella laminariae TaxID=454162 RepID=A0ABT4LPG3_9PROT|nr:DUF4198 domain-containing protein [Kiloniella laminariae]MCZ4283030.1 DUF4198 domain-containing protein [Kiloniella laminariae]
MFFSRHLLLLLAGFSGIISPASAHFLELVPSTALVTKSGESRLSFDIRFTHPMEGGPLMNIERLDRFGVQTVDGKHDLTGQLIVETLPMALNPARVQSYTADYSIRRAGDYTFYASPSPYWEAEEKTMIIHHTKVVVNAYGLENGWETPVGLPVEIMPLSRPYGLWTGNIFSGQVMNNGTPEGDAIIEIEYRGEGKITPLATPYITQTIRTDENGVFHYAMPKAGWWVFAALLDTGKTLPAPDGTEAPVEEGGLIWVHTQNMP